MLRKKELDKHSKEIEKILDKEDVDEELKLEFSVDLDDIRPPSHGHIDDSGVGQDPDPDDPFVESLEHKLCAIFENLQSTSGSPGGQIKAIGKIGTVGPSGILGTHSKTTEKPKGTPAEERREEADKYNIDRNSVTSDKERAKEYEEEQKEEEVAAKESSKEVLEKLK